MKKWFYSGLRWFAAAIVTLGIMAMVILVLYGYSLLIGRHGLIVAFLPLIATIFFRITYVVKNIIFKNED